MNQLTLRQIPESVEKKLRMTAAETGQSINKTIITLLEKALGIGKKQYRQKKRDLSRFAGLWTKTEAEEFEKNSLVFEQVDPEVWR